MTTELEILALFGLLIMVLVAIQALFALQQFGLLYLAGPRDEKLELTGMGARCQRALANSAFGMILFAPAVLFLAVMNVSTPSTLLAAQAFLIARLIYIPLYLFGISWVRTAAWLVGFLATAFIFLQAF
ncbi:MAPEG family protein [Amylibacter sp.]|nr:MAPEG family protein [Amylibacter sp.]